MFRFELQDDNHAYRNLRPGAGYLSVLISNWQLGESFKRLESIVRTGIQVEEAKNKAPKFGYGSRFNSARVRRTSSTVPRPLSRRSENQRLAYSLVPSPLQQTSDSRFYDPTTSTPVLPLTQANVHRLEAEANLSSFRRATLNTENFIQGTLDSIYAAQREQSRNTAPLWFPNSEFSCSLSKYMLSSPELPAVGLERSKTNVDVFSNLSSYNRSRSRLADKLKSPAAGPLPFAKAGLQLQLLEAVKGADIEQAKNILDNNETLSLRFVDQNDCTVLHHCFDIKNRGVNLDILKLLLDRDAPVDYSGKTEGPILHVSARIGHSLCVYQLLRWNADANVLHKKTLRTALHEAVGGGHKISAVILLYFGADPTIRDRDGRRPVDLCKDDRFLRQDFRAIVESVETNQTEIQELTSISVTHFEILGVTVKLRSQREDTFPIVFRRQILETCKTSFSFKDDEEIGSDVFAYYLLKVPDGDTASFTIPLFEKSVSQKDRIVLKTHNGDVLTETDVTTGNNGLCMKFDAALRQSECMVAVCQPQREEWKVGRSQQVLSSSTDKSVQFYLKQNTFQVETILSLQVIELPEDADISEGDILASTPFFDVNATSTPAEDITIELPKPSVSGVDGQITVLAKSGDEWNVMDIQSDRKENTVTFAERNLPVFATVLLVKPGTDSMKLAREMNETLKHVVEVEYKVCFLCFAKRQADTKLFTVLVECCEYKYLDQRRRWWSSQGFQIQKWKDPMARITSRSKQAFRLMFYESRITRKDPKSVDIQFHCKRDNFVQFTVELKGKTVKFINGRLFVYVVTPSETTDERVLEREPVTWFDVSLVLNQMEIGQGSCDSGDTRSVSTISVKSLNLSSLDSTSQTTSSSSRSRSYDRTSSTFSSSTDKMSSSVAGSSRSSDTQTGDFQTDGLKKIQASLARAIKNIDPIAITDSTSVEAAPLMVEQKADYTNSMFLDDTLLDFLTEELAEDWYKIFVLMGIPFDDIEYALMHSADTTTAKKQLFRKWRDDHKEDEDLGLPLLLAALFKGGCRNVAAQVQIKLRDWYENWKGKDVIFQEWVTKAYQNSDLLVPSDYPKPMSDSYLVLMSDDLPLSPEVARALMVGDSVMANIQQNEAYLNDKIRVMKLLTLFRDKSSRGVDALETLIKRLEELGLEKLRNYVVMCAKAWLKRTATRKDDPLRYQVDNLLKTLH